MEFEKLVKKLASKLEGVTYRLNYLQNYIRTAGDKYASYGLEAHYEDDGEHYEETLEFKDERSGEYFERLNREMIVEVIRNNGLTGRKAVFSFRRGADNTADRPQSWSFARQYFEDERTDPEEMPEASR